MKEPLVSSSQGYCSTNLLTQEVSQHIALFDAQSARFPKILSGLSEPVQLFLLPAGCGDAFDELFLEQDVKDNHRDDRDNRTGH